MISFLKATNEAHFTTIAFLATTIWEEHYTPIIGKNQVAYMLQRFQSAKTISAQVKEGYQYFILMFITTAIGYIAVQKRDSSLFISKIYILKPERGKGFVRNALHFIETMATNLICDTICLTVNKNNTVAIKAYEALGFKNTRAVVMDIGNGFIMDDFVMEKFLK